MKVTALNPTDLVILGTDRVLIASFNHALLISYNPMTHKDEGTMIFYADIEDHFQTHYEEKLGETVNIPNEYKDILFKIVTASNWEIVDTPEGGFRIK
jgi:hypothetical protein